MHKINSAIYLKLGLRITLAFMPILLVNANLKKLRNTIGVTQDKFAKLVNSNRANIGACEEMRITVPLKIIMACVESGVLLRDELYSFLFDEHFSPSTTIRDHKTKKVKNISNRYHGKTGTKEYRTWINMRARCRTPSSSHYERYGGRGIIVCERWDNSFIDFYNDMGDAPSSKHEIDRINNNGNYEPDNCRWATKKEQNNNKSPQLNGLKITHNDKTKPVSGWAKEAGVSHGTIRRRLKMGWPIDKAISLGRMTGNKHKTKL